MHNKTCGSLESQSLRNKNKFLYCYESLGPENKDLINLKWSWTYLAKKEDYL